MLNHFLEVSLDCPANSCTRASAPPVFDTYFWDAALPSGSGRCRIPMACDADKAGENTRRNVYTRFLQELPKISICDVHCICRATSKTPALERDKGLKLYAMQLQDYIVCLCAYISLVT